VFCQYLERLMPVSKISNIDIEGRKPHSTSAALR
jgi:hypothetical protein